jgi:glycosyltransferase involved in cell wall biosynthesis
VTERLLVVSSWAPPTIGGTPTVVRNLLAALRRTSSQVEVDVLRQRVRPEESTPPSCPTTTLARPRFLENVRGGHYALAPAVFAIVLARLLRRRDLRVVITLPEESFALAAAAACRLARRPYALYMHNTYAEQMTHPLDKLLARVAERWLLTGARPLISLSEPLRELYAAKYGVDSVVVPHIVDVEEYAGATNGALPLGLTPRSYAVFTGDVYGMNLDALRRLGHVLAERFRGRLSFVVSGQKAEAELRELGVTPDVVVTGADRATVVALQRNAAILLAPLAFDSPFPEDVRTAFPTKVFEYLAADAPMLVHAPAGSALADAAEAHGWALVVTSRSEEELGRAMERLLTDTQLRERLRERCSAATERHRPENVAQAFIDSLP